MAIQYLAVSVSKVASKLKIQRVFNNELRVSIMHQHDEHAKHAEYAITSSIVGIFAVAE